MLGFVNSPQPTRSSWAMDLAEQIRQYEEMVKQLEQLKKQYEAMTKGRGMGDMLMDPKFKNYLPEEWKGVYDAIRSGGYGGLNSKAKGIYDAAKQYDVCANISPAIPNGRSICEARAVKAAQDKAYYDDAFELAKERMDQIEELLHQAAETEDQKEILEIQARIQGEQAMLTNEATKMKMFELMSAAEERIQSQMAHEISHRMLFGTGEPDEDLGGQDLPIDWNN